MPLGPVMRRCMPAVTCSRGVPHWEDASLASQPLPSALLLLCNSCSAERRGWRPRLGGCHHNREDVTTAGRMSPQQGGCHHNREDVTTTGRMSPQHPPQQHSITLEQHTLCNTDTQLMYTCTNNCRTLYLC